MAGNSNSGPKKEKPFLEALRMEISEAAGDRKRLRTIAKVLLSRAESGDIAAIQEVANRLDGKPTQAIDHSGEVTKTYVVRMPQPVADMAQWQDRYTKPKPKTPKRRQ